jgi:CHAT domain-containing protein/tetratricopeptide (TPR) repeat protein
MLSRFQDAALGVVTAGCAFAGLVACNGAPESQHEQVVLDERIQLTRANKVDSAKREWIAKSDATCVAIVEEDDSDVTVTLAAKDSAGAGESVTVQSVTTGLGVEVATVHVTRAASVALSMTAPRVGKVAGVAPTQVTCYADAAGRDPATSARLTAYRAWTQATLAGPLDAGRAQQHIASMDAAIAALESPAGDARMAAVARYVRASLFYQLEISWKESYHAARSAERAFAALAKPDAHNQARARVLAAMALIEIVGDGSAKDPSSAEAMALVPGMLKELERPETPLSAIEHHRVINFAGIYCYEIDDYPCAESRMKEALEGARADHNVGDVLKIISNLGVVSMERGEYQDSAKYFAEVIAQLDDTVGHISKTVPLVSAAYVEGALGHTEAAIELLTRASKIDSGSQHDKGRIAHGFGLEYWRRGDLAQAEAFFAEGLRIHRQASDANGMNASLRVSGMLARETGNLPEAIKLHQEALGRAAQPSAILRAKWQLARDYAATGDFARAIATIREGLAAGSASAPNAFAAAQLLLVEYQLARGITRTEISAARTPVREALELAVRRSDVQLEMQARRVQAALLAASGDLTNARREYERAIALIFDFRGSASSPELRTTVVSHEQSTFREYVDLLMRGSVARGAGRFATASGSEESALRVLELARALNFDAVRDTRLDAAQQARLDDLLQQMAAKRVRMAALMERRVPEGGDLAQLQLDMANLRLQVDRLRGTAGKEAKSELPSLVERPLSKLAPGVAQLSYAQGKSHTYLWVRDAMGLRVAVLSEAPAQIERKLEELAKLNELHEAGKVQTALLGLSGTLLPPRSLAADSTAIDVVVEGNMASVPFAALRSPLDRARRLVETHDVRMITSMFETGTSAPASRRAMSFIGISSGSGKVRSAAQVFPALGTTHAEGEALAAMFEKRGGEARIKLLTGDDGNVASIKALWAGGAEVMHFATHGLANFRQPIASLLLLPAKSEKGEATYLTAGQVREWRGDAGLVFLGACESAAGPARFGDGIPGLPRAFLRAGARGVVATLWPVEDVSASLFSVDFYRRFAADGDAARALAETQRTWLMPVKGESAGDQARRLMTAWAHVFYVRSSE